MSDRLAVLSLIGGAAAFGASSAVLALMGLGIPFILAALLAAICAGLLIYGVGRLTPAEPAAAHASADLETRIRQLEETSSHLRHDLRGVLSPALMMADRLLKNEDPAIRRAGEAVVRSVERATTLLAENKQESVAAESPTEPGAGAAPPRSHAA
jgi:hypothetical protein